MKRCVFTPLAANDLEEILEYIERDRPLVAERVAERISNRIEQLRRNPQSGQVREEYPGDYRSTTVQRWVIFYRNKEDTLEIHRILDGSRDIDSLMGD